MSAFRPIGIFSRASRHPEMRRTRPPLSVVGPSFPACDGRCGMRRGVFGIEARPVPGVDGVSGRVASGRRTAGRQPAAPSRRCRAASFRPPRVQAR